ncbi:MAG: hypothetical protein M0Z54_09805 [Thermaerobacter sp.]|nr:hypothetical protein [Thermaerobacter sp.]
MPIGSGTAGAGGTEAVVMVLVVVWALSRQFRSRVFRIDRVVVTPMILAVLMVVAWPHVRLTPAEVWVTVGTGGFALVAGYVRGRAVRMERGLGGQVLSTGGWGTVVIYAVTLGLHFALDAVFHVSNPRLLEASALLYLVALMAGRLVAMVPRARTLLATPPAG